MRIGITSINVRTVGAAIDAARHAEGAGFDTCWIPGGWRDPLTLLAVAGQFAPRVRLGAGIVSIYGSHPTALAEQALTVNNAVGGRLVLGVGTSHSQMVEQRFGESFDRPIRRLREFLTILGSLLDTGAVDYSGAVLSAHTELRIADLPRPPVLVAALSPMSLRVAGALADGTTTNFLAPPILERETIPTITAAATEAGRPAPRIVVSMPVLITHDAAAGEATAAEALGVYQTRYTAYRSVFERQGVDGPHRLAVVGDEETVAKELARYAGIGVEEFVAYTFGSPADQARTTARLRAVIDAR